jgi:hypothetical protein
MPTILNVGFQFSSKRTWNQENQNPSIRIVQLLKSLELQSADNLVCFDVILFTDLPVSEVLQVVRNKLHSDDTMVEWSVLQTEACLGLLNVCLTMTYFKVSDKSSQQKHGIAMGSSLSPNVSNIYIEHFKELGFRLAQHKPLLWLCYVDDTFVVCLMAQSSYKILSAILIV